MEYLAIGNSDPNSTSTQLDAVLRAFPHLLLTVDSKGRILEFRRGKAATDLFPPEESLGRSLQDFLPVDFSSRVLNALQESIKSDKVVNLDYNLQSPLGEHWFEAHLVPTKKESRATLILQDITERMRNSERIQTQFGRLTALHAIDAAIAASFDLKVTLSVILRQLINYLGVDAADILILNPSSHMLEYAVGQGLQAFKPQQVPLMIGQGFAGKAALERRTISIFDLAKQPDDSVFSLELALEKFTSYYAVPLIAKGQVKGVLETYHRNTMKTDEEWLDFLATVSGQAAVAIDSACLFQDLQHANAELNLAYDSTVESWIEVLRLSKREDGAHIIRVVDLTVRLAHAMGISGQELVHFRRGAMLHDIGKLGIPESILEKSGTLDQQEMEIIQSHPQIACQLLGLVTFLAPVMDIPHYHHERWNGSGYPEGLCEDQIPFPARLFAVVDTYDAMTTEKPYRAACSNESVLNFLFQNSGKLFDPAVVKAFVHMMSGDSLVG